jgi:CYTH domain-containing protein
MQNKEIETERRFLLKKLPEDLMNFPYIMLEDFMILTDEPHPHLRLRRKGDSFVLTKKYPKGEGSKLQMIEETIVLNEIEFNAIKELKVTGQKKWRFNYLYKDLNAELDVWTDKLQGLAIIEFEFDSEKEAKVFEKPDFCLKEVTEEEWLAGGKLSGKSYSDLAKQLSELEYTPIELDLNS